MKAVISADAPGAEDVSVAELPDPLAGPGEVLIRVSYCGVNYPDVLLLQDRYQLRPQRPFARRRGRRRGGRRGEGVSGFAPGDRVMARMSLGGMAELWPCRRTGCTRFRPACRWTRRRPPDDLPDRLPRAGPAGIDPRRTAAGARRGWRGRPGRRAARQGHVGWPGGISPPGSHPDPGVTVSRHRALLVLTTSGL